MLGMLIVDGWKGTCLCWGGVEGLDGLTALFLSWSYLSLGRGSLFLLFYLGERALGSFFWLFGLPLFLSW